MRVYNTLHGLGTFTHVCSALKMRSTSVANSLKIDIHAVAESHPVPSSILATHVPAGYHDLSFTSNSPSVSSAIRRMFSIIMLAYTKAGFLRSTNRPLVSTCEINRLSTTQPGFLCVHKHCVMAVLLLY